MTITAAGAPDAVAHTPIEQLAYVRERKALGLKRTGGSLVAARAAAEKLMQR